MNKKMDDTNVRVIKISKQALLEFIYENFIDDQEMFLDVDSRDITASFDINWKRGEFIFCAYKTEDAKGNIINLPKEIDLQQLLKNMEDTTTTMYTDGRYREYTKEELVELSKRL